VVRVRGVVDQKKDTIEKDGQRKVSHGESRFPIVASVQPAKLSINSICDGYSTAVEISFSATVPNGKNHRIDSHRQPRRRVRRNIIEKPLRTA
jgi:hypothetical protein